MTVMNRRMSDSEDYEDFGSGDESWDEFEEDIELDKADSVDAIENLQCLFLRYSYLLLLIYKLMFSSQLFKSKIEKEAASFASSRKISVSVAKTILMKSKWNTTTASKLLSNSKYGDKLVRSRKSHCDGKSVINRNNFVEIDQNLTRIEISSL